MVTRIVCYPPLGQTTVVQEKQAELMLCIELEKAEVKAESLEAVLWHSGLNGQWTELPFKHLTNVADLSIHTVSNQQRLCSYHSCTLSTAARPAQIHFTLRFRARNQTWQWAKDAFGEQDGEIRFQDPSFKPHTLQSCCPTPDLALNIAPTSGGLGNNAAATVWEISDTVPGAEDPNSGYRTRKIGLPRDFSHWFALVRHSTAWIAPRQGQNEIRLDGDAIVCSFLRKDGLHLLFLAVTTEDVLTVLKTNDCGELLMVGKNDSLHIGQCVVVAALGSTLEDTMAAAVAGAENVVRKSEPSLPTIWNKASEEVVNDSSTDSQGWFNGLTYCTWNALGQDLDQGKIHNALQVLVEHGITITNLLIDDNWQSLDHAGANQFERGWVDFEASGIGFPDKLSGLTASIRHNHPNIRHVGVWHGIFGYWGGFSPDGGLARRYSLRSVNKERDYCDRESFTVVDGEDAARLYEDFYAFLQKSGIDSAKADTRYLLDCLCSSKDRRGMIRRYNNAWLEASAKYLSMRVISCMSMIPQLLFSPELLLKRATDQDQQKLIMRNSDDFFPEVESSHLWHVFWNAHNAVFTQHLNIIADWDMFQTTHDYSGFHATARCVSGGPICISDYPGKHNLTLIKQLVANLPDGSSIILRPSVMGRSVQAYTAHSEERFCKVATFQDIPCGEHRPWTGTAIMGVFNMSTQTQVEFLPLLEFLNFKGSGIEYALRSHVTGDIVVPLSGASTRSLVKLELGHRGYDILTLYPLLPLHGGRQIAVMGLLGQMTGAAAIIGIDVKADDRIVTTRLKALGSFGLFMTGPGNDGIPVFATITLCGTSITQAFQTVEHTTNGILLKIDLEGAWKESSLPDQQIVVEAKIRE
ncbi:MAG: hypothetical protein LQ349_006794 [Xanthoria aureola]|nr:MAG: hypothetical protein LQ349_006794 [Xanthoria aureola]